MKRYPADVLRRRRLIALALIAAAAIGLAVDRCSAFEPYTVERRVNNGPTVIEWTQAPGPFNCPAAAWKAGHEVMAVLGSGILFFYVECSLYQPGKCQIISDGSDYELGHEFRHCLDGEYHVPGLPFFDLD